MVEQELLNSIQKDKILVYLYDRDSRRLCEVPLQDRRFVEHSLKDVIHLTHQVLILLIELGKEEMVYEMYHYILFSSNHEIALTPDQIRQSLRRFENFVQALGFLLYGYKLHSNEPNYYNGDNVLGNPKTAIIKLSHLKTLVAGEAGSASQKIKLPLLAKGKTPFVDENDTLHRGLLETIDLFRGKIIHSVAIIYEEYELYNIGNCSSKYIRRDLALSALLMIDYHYVFFSKLVNN